MNRLTDHFTEEEFACPHCQKVVVDSVLVTLLEDLRVRLGFPLHINSGYRCPEYNRTLKDAVSDSAHTYGLAFDISCSDGDKRFRIVEGALAIGFKRVGVGKSFVHLDTGSQQTGHPAPRIWTY